MSDLKSQLVETSETVGEFHWSSLHPADALREEKKARGEIIEMEQRVGRYTDAGMLALCSLFTQYHTVYMDVYHPTLHVVCSVYLMRMGEKVGAGR